MGTLENLVLSSLPGLGVEDFPGFPADECPEALPEIARHHSSLADVLKKDADVYERLRRRKTSLGVGLARCMKVGMDNRGHAMVKTIGIIAGDEECYEVFRELFDPVIRRHLAGPQLESGSHPTILPSTGLKLPPADPHSRFVVSSQIRVYRSLRGFRMPPAMSLEERAQVERISVSAFAELQGSLRGEYFPLPGSQTHSPKIGGMSDEEEEALRSSSLLFEAPDSTLRLCTGGGRHWPHARGVFVNGDQTFCAWVNEQEHLRLVTTQKGYALDKAFSELVRALDAIAAAMRRESEDKFGAQVFSRSNRLGFLTSNPAILGTTMHISIMVKLPCLGTLETDGVSTPPWRAWCLRQRVQVRRGCAESGAPVPGLFEVCNCDRFGVSEVELVMLVHEVLKRMLQMELRLEAGEAIDDLMEAPVVPSKEHSSVNKVVDKGRSCLLSGLASGQLADAICAVGMEATSSAVNHEDAALVATASRITSVSPKAHSDAGLRDVEHACAEAVVNGIVDAMILKEDSKHDGGSGVILSTTPSLCEDEGLDEIRLKVQQVLLTACESGDLELAFKGASESIAKSQASETEVGRQSEEQYDTGSALARARQRKHEKQQQRLRARRGEATADGKTDTSRAKAFQSAPGHYETAAFDTSSAIARARERKQEKQRRRTGEQAHGETKAEKTEVEVEELQSLDELKDKLHSRIADAFDTGRLEEVMATALTSPREPPAKESEKTALEEEADALEPHLEIDDLRLKLHGRITNALEEGKLDSIMKESLNTTDRGSKTERGSVMVDAPPPVIAEAQPATRQSGSTSPQVAGGENDGERTKRGSLMVEPPERMAPPNPPSMPKPAPPKAEAAVLDVAGSQELGQELYAKEEEMRLKARSILMKATLDDSLDRALALVEAENEADLEKEAVEAVRLNIRNVLEQSQENGRLQQALKQMQDDHLEDIRLNMSELLWSACESGDLSAALQNSKDDQLENIRSNMSALLMAACDNGDLDNALQQFQDDKLEDIRLNMSELLWAACESGDLETALTKTKDNTGDDREAAKQRARDALIAALGDDEEDNTGDDRESAKQRARDALLAALGDDEEDNTGDDKETAKQRARDALLAALGDDEEDNTGDDKEAAKQRARDALIAALGDDEEDNTGDDKEAAKQRARDALLAALGDDEEDNTCDDREAAKQRARDALLAALGDDEEDNTGDDKEAAKQRARDALIAALGDDEEDNSLEDIRANMSALLFSACESGHLEQALENTKAQTPASTPMKPTYLGTPSSPVKSGSEKKATVVLAMEAMSQRDRRIGELMAMINEAKQQLVEKDENCQLIEGKLGAARVDLAHLDLDMEWHRRALDDAKERSNELEAGQRKLLSELDGHQLRWRHARIEAEETCHMSARSELSTATGGATAPSSLGCFTPRNVISTTVLDPLLLSTPLPPNRW